MKTFQERFKDVIDGTDGTVVLNEQSYKEIQADALILASNLCNCQFESVDDSSGHANRGVGNCCDAITTEIKRLWQGTKSGVEESK